MKPTFFATPAELRAWFEANHSAAKELLVGYYKRGSGRPSITWPESVDEALCFGWIDGVRRSIDEDAYTIRFTPRKPTSIWSAINVAKVAALETLGRMTPAGRRAFEKRTPERTGVYSFERDEAARLDAAEERELRAHTKAAAFFDAQPPWYRRTATHWVVSPKRPATRRRRFEHLLSQSARGLTIGPLTRKPRDGAADVASPSPAPPGSTGKRRATKAKRSEVEASRARGSPRKVPSSGAATARAKRTASAKAAGAVRPARARKKAARLGRGGARAGAGARKKPKG